MTQTAKRFCHGIPFERPPPISSPKAHQCSPIIWLPLNLFNQILDHSDLRDRFSLRRASREIKLKVDQYLAQREELIVNDDYHSIDNKWHFTNKLISFQEVVPRTSAHVIVALFNGLQRLQIKASLDYDDLLKFTRLPNLKNLELELKDQLLAVEREKLYFPKLNRLTVRFAADQIDTVWFCSPALEFVCLRGKSIEFFTPDDYGQICLLEFDYDTSGSSTLFTSATTIVVNQCLRTNLDILLDLAFMSRVNKLFLNLNGMTDLSEKFTDPTQQPTQQLTQLYQLAKELWETCETFLNKKKIFLHGIRLVEQMKDCLLEHQLLISHYHCTRSSLVAKRLPQLKRIEYGVWYELSQVREYPDSYFATNFHLRYSNIHQISFIRPASKQALNVDNFVSFLAGFSRVTSLDFGNLHAPSEFYDQLSERCNLSGSLISLRLFDNADDVQLDFDFLSEFHCLRLFATNLVTRGLTPTVTACLPSSATLKLYFKPDSDCDGHLLKIVKQNRKRYSVTITNEHLKVNAHSLNFTVQRQLGSKELKQFLYEFRDKLEF